MRLCRRRLACLAPSLKHARHDHVAAIVLRDLLEEPSLAPRGGRLVRGIDPPVRLHADRGKDAIERNELERHLDGRQVIETRARCEVASGGSEQLIAQCGIGSLLLGRGSLMLLPLLGLTRLAILEPANDIERYAVVRVVRRRPVPLNVPGSRIRLPCLDARNPFLVCVAIARGRKRLGRGQPINSLRYALKLLGLHRPKYCLLAAIPIEAGARNYLRDGLISLALGEMVHTSLTGPPLI